MPADGNVQEGTETVNARSIRPSNPSHGPTAASERRNAGEGWGAGVPTSLDVAYATPAAMLLFLLTLHFTRFGPHDFGGQPVEPRPDDYERIQRFSWFERMLHLIVLLVFLFLAFTGLAFSFDGWRWLQLVFGDNVTPRVWHGWLGFVFGAGVLVMLLRWWRDALLVKSDIVWVRKLGG